MTTMKALPMLDHVMLWVARGFAIFALAFVVTGIWFRYTDTDDQLLYKYDHQPIFNNSDLLFFACCLIWCGIWLICLWHSPTKITRTILGLTAGYVFIYMLQATFDRWPSAWFATANLQSVAQCDFVFLGTFSMVSTAIRISKTHSANLVIP